MTLLLFLVLFIYIFLIFYQWYTILSVTTVREYYSFQYSDYYRNCPVELLLLFFFNWFFPIPVGNTKGTEGQPQRRRRSSPEEATSAGNAATSREREQDRDRDRQQKRGNSRRVAKRAPAKIGPLPSMTDVALKEMIESSLNEVWWRGSACVRVHAHAHAHARAFFSFCVRICVRTCANCQTRGHLCGIFYFSCSCSCSSVFVDWFGCYKEKVYFEWNHTTVGHRSPTRPAWYCSCLFHRLVAPDSRFSGETGALGLQLPGPAK